MNYTWEMLVSAWPVQAEHPLVDCPGEFQEEFEKFVRVDSFAKDDWYSGLTAARVFGHSQALWQHEYIEPSVLACLGPDSVIIFGTCLGEFVWKIEGTVRSLLTLCLFNSRNVGYLTRICGQTVRFPAVQVAVVKRSVYVFFVMTGPRVTDVRSFVGNSQSVIDVVSDVDQTWFICSAPLRREEVSVPSSLKAMWLRKVNAQRKKDFLDPGFYLRQFTSYTVWSYEVHYQQVQQALLLVPSGSTVVSPGDGIGLVASLWSGPVISGDMVHSPLSHRLVEVESFAETMARGQQSGNVLFLSYVFSLMSPREQLQVQTWDGPVVVIDNRDVSPGPGFSHVGPGVYVLGLSGSAPLGVDFVPTDRQLFSENLLALREISYVERNPSVLYWEQLRPLGNSQPYSGDSSVLVVHSLPELSRYLLRDVKTGIYLTSIGRSFVGTKPIYIDISTKFVSGVVYELARDHLAVEFLKGYSHWTDLDGLFLFCFQRSCHMQRKGTKWEMRPVKLKDAVNYPCRLMSHQGGKVFLATMQGMVSVDVTDVRRRYGILLYLENFSHPSWKDVYASGSVVNLIGSKFLQIVDDFRKLCAENLDVHSFPWVRKKRFQVDFSEKLN